MTKKEQEVQKAQDIIDHLAAQLQKGWHAYCAAKHLYQLGPDGKNVNSMIALLSISQASCLEMALLTLAKLTEKHSDSITLDYLLNHIKTNTNIFMKSQKQAFLECIAQHELKIDQYNHTISSLREQRDRSIAHLDRKHINDPSQLYRFPPATSSEIEELFIQLLSIINTYAQYVGPSRQIMLDPIEPAIINDVDYLADLIDRANKDDFDRMRSSWHKYQ